MTNAPDALTMNTKKATPAPAKARLPGRGGLALVFGIVALALANFAGAAPFAYVANNGDGNVSLIDLATGSTLTKITVGTSPLGVTQNAAGTKVYVSNFGSSSVSVIDTATNTVSATINVGAEP